LRASFAYRDKKVVGDNITCVFRARFSATEPGKPFLSSFPVGLVPDDGSATLYTTVDDSDA
jgi:hypothetical protein